jgi:hypothetical protein
VVLSDGVIALLAAVKVPIFGVYEVLQAVPEEVSTVYFVPLITL